MPRRRIFFRLKTTPGRPDRGRADQIVEEHADDGGQDHGAEHADAGDLAQREGQERDSARQGQARQGGDHRLGKGGATSRRAGKRGIGHRNLLRVIPHQSN